MMNKCILLLVTWFALLSMATAVHGADKVVVVPLFSSGGILATPYQFIYDVSSSPGGTASCDSIPVPADKILTITSIGVESTVDLIEDPDVYLLLARDVGSGFIAFRFGGPVNFVEQALGRKTYRGVYTLMKILGNTTNGVNYRASICVAGASSSATLPSTARGVISGYVTESSFIDGNSLE